MKATMQRVPLSVNSILERASTHYSRSEIVSRLPDKSIVRCTFGDVYRRARQLASGLKALGLKKGERVATLSWNHYAHVESYFGIPAAGGVAHTLNLRLTPEEISWIANHAQDRFLIVDDVLLPLYEKIKDHVNFEKVIVIPLTGAPVQSPLINYEQFLEEAPKDFDYVAHEEDDPVSMCYTSGTTGRPKGVVYTHRSTVLHTLIASLPDHWGLTGRDSVLAVTPLFHVNCWGVPYACVMMGIKLILPGPHLAPADLLDLVSAEQPSYALGVPTIWLGMVQLLDTQPDKYRLPKGMRMLVGGAAVPESLIRAFARHDAEIVQAWGMTETSPLVCLSYVKPELANIGDDERFKLKTSVGVNAPLIDLRLMNDEGQLQPWDGKSRGEIQVRGPTITGSYYNVPHDPEKFTKDGWLRTGDVATVDEHGYVRIVDRTKDLIKSGGEWISSVDMENLLMGHPAVAEAAVIAIPDEKWTERPMACVVAKPNAKVTPEQLREHLSTAFAKWQLPDRFEFIDAVPRTSTGKFWKAKLRERFVK
ncbi:MAG TPA: long-chain fatty acid--CoA ligase [Steroidobacteraceae bacterium]|nr:long-chain fatty acid--CoA ligase [Steroidobacteraceae bacterium]